MIKKSEDILYIVAGIISAIVLLGWFLLEALKDLVPKLASYIVALALFYVAIFIFFGLVIFPVIDLLAALAKALAQRRRVDQSMRNSCFPRFQHLQDSKVLDSIFWKMIDYHLGLKTVRLRKGLRSAHHRKKAISRYIDLRNTLLNDEHAFSEWRRKYLPTVIRQPYNQSTLHGIYNVLWRRFREEAQTPSNSTGFAAIVADKIISSPEPVSFHLTKNILYFLSFGRLFDREKAAFCSLSDPNERVFPFLRNGHQFRALLKQFFFEIANELEEILYDSAVVLREFEKRQHQEGHYLLLPEEPNHKLIEGRKKKAKLTSARPQSMKPKNSVPDTDREKIATISRQQENDLIWYREIAERKSKELGVTLKKLRTQYLKDLSPGALFHQYRNEQCKFGEDVDLLVEDLVEGEREEKTRQAARLKRSKKHFQSFWEQHELEILQNYEDRLQAERYLTEQNEMERQKTVADKSFRAKLEELSKLPFSELIPFLLAKLEAAQRHDLQGENHTSLLKLHNFLKEIFRKNERLEPEQLDKVLKDVYRINQIETILNLIDEKIKNVSSDETLEDMEKQIKTDFWMRYREREMLELEG